MCVKLGAAKIYIYIYIYTYGVETYLPRPFPTLLERDQQRGSGERMTSARYVFLYVQHNTIIRSTLDVNIHETKLLLYYARFFLF